MASKEVLRTAIGFVDLVGDVLDAGGLALRPAGRRMLKGMPEPVEVWTIEFVG